MLGGPAQLSSCDRHSVTHNYHLPSVQIAVTGSPSQPTGRAMLGLLLRMAYPVGWAYGVVLQNSGYFTLAISPPLMVTSAYHLRLYGLGPTTQNLPSA